MPFPPSRKSAFFNRHRKAYRIKFRPALRGLSARVEDGDELRVRFDAGEFENPSRGVRLSSAPMPEALREIIEIGGFPPALKKRLEAPPS